VIWQANSRRRTLKCKRESTTKQQTRNLCRTPPPKKQQAGKGKGQKPEGTKKERQQEKSQKGVPITGRRQRAERKHGNGKVFVLTTYSAEQTNSQKSRAFLAWPQTGVKRSRFLFCLKEASSKMRGDSREN